MHASSGCFAQWSTRASARVAGGLVAIAALATALIAPGAAAAAKGRAAIAQSRAAVVTPRHGGSLTVLEGSDFAGSWPGLDPATNTNGDANSSMMDSIFGELFEVSPTGASIPDLATGYRFLNGNKTIEIFLRKGVRFSDGTPFNAAAVVWNWKRDLSANCTCKPVFNQSTPPIIKAAGPYAVEITLQYVDAPFIIGLQGDVFNWIASPTAVSKMGEKAFALKPVGAGPFEVVSDTPSNTLVLKRNPHYWNKGLPYLNTLIFKAVADDEAALEAMQAGSGQAYELGSTVGLEPAFRSRFTYLQLPSSSPYDIQLNTLAPPFNNIKAREAIYYATNCALLDKKLFDDQEPCGQSFTAPGGLFYKQNVPGYLTYNLKKAKALVKQLGGLSVNLVTISSPVALALDEGLQTMWQQAGMKVTLSQDDLPALIGAFVSKKWQAALQTCGAFDPATNVGGVSVGFRFASTSAFSGVHDGHLNGLLERASEVLNPVTRQKYYDAAAAYIAKKAYGPFLFSIDGFDAVVHGAGIPAFGAKGSAGPGWEYAYNNNP
jgi:peptide/nickel transport system substrate-binding protein